MNAHQLAPHAWAAQTDRQGFVGSWHIIFFENAGAPTRGLATISADGTVITSEHPVVTPPMAAGPVFTSTGHGAWAPTGPDSAIVTFFGLGSLADGALFGTVAAQSSISLSEDGRSFGGEAILTIADPEGVEMAVYPGRFEATRIVIERPATPST
jgi:hypothetical protein